MRLYIIGFMVGVIGLVAANQVRAADDCGLRSEGVFKVAGWHTEKAQLDLTLISIDLVSMDAKTISEVSGSVEFMAGGDSIFSLPITLHKPAEPGVRFPLEYLARDRNTAKRLAGAHVIACVASMTYADGSGVIIN